MNLLKKLNIGKNKAYELINTGKIKSIKIGRKIRIPKKAIIEFIENENK
ncbi:helix-turn-helix domain-containing protein [Caloranaerobacter sp. DY30410]